MKTLTGRFKTIAAFGLIGFVLLACGEEKKKNETVSQEETEMTESEMTAPDNDANTIFAIASENEDFSSLITALEAADMSDTMNNDGPFTVFAPTNDAFAKLEQGTMDALLEPDNEEKLIGLLSYHVVPKAYKSDAVEQAIKENDGAFPVETIEGAVLTFTMGDGGNIIVTDAAGNTAQVVQADVEASNGVIHAINDVMMPN